MAKTKKRKLNRNESINLLAKRLLPYLIRSVTKHCTEKKLPKSWDRALFNRAMVLNNGAFSPSSNGMQLLSLGIVSFFGLISTYNHKQYLEILQERDNIKYNDLVKLIRSYTIFINSYFLYTEIAFKTAKEIMEGFYLEEVLREDIHLTEGELEIIEEVIKETNDIDPKLTHWMDTNITGKMGEIQRNTVPLIGWYNNVIAGHINDMCDICEELEGSKYDYLTGEEYIVLVKVMELALNLPGGKSLTGKQVSRMMNKYLEVINERTSDVVPYDQYIERMKQAEKDTAEMITRILKGDEVLPFKVNQQLILAASAVEYPEVLA